jgi:hypothetical protein
MDTWTSLSETRNPRLGEARLHGLGGGVSPRLGFPAKSVREGKSASRRDAATNGWVAEWFKASGLKEAWQN